MARTREDEMNDIKALRDALVLATPGPWQKRGSLGPKSAPHLKGPMVIERADGQSLAHMTGWRDDQQTANAAYIAACSPDRISRLLDAIAAIHDAASVALEAMEMHGKQYSHMTKGYMIDAETNLREALAVGL
jgi:hypothetical protein